MPSRFSPNNRPALPVHLTPGEPDPEPEMSIDQEIDLIFASYGSGDGPFRGIGSRQGCLGARMVCGDRRISLFHI